jgi:hypothetical protein
VTLSINVLTLLILCHFWAPATAHAQSCSQLQSYLQGYQNLLQQYQQYYNAYNCGNSTSQTCTLVRQGIASAQQNIQTIQNALNSSCGGSGGGTGQDPCTVTRNYISQAADASYNQWYSPVANYISHNYSYFISGRLHGFILYYETPPVYCTLHPQYTPAARPYYASWDQALRVVSQFHNNGYKIDNIVPY